jgi:predicted ATPase/DNA-binding XRE family transcriptional regulator
MNDGSEPFGEVLRRLRSAAALSQESLAERAGLSRNGISDLERGARLTPRLETVRLLAEALTLGDTDRMALLAAARPALQRIGPSAASTAAAPTLPPALTRLIGREDEVAALRATLHDESVRLLTLTGPGGVGKTRLAIAAALAVAAEFRDGVVAVELATITDPALVLPAIARALDIRETLGRPVAEALMMALRNLRLLLVLDNFEHVLEAAPAVAGLLTVCPRLTVLVTSRAPLRLSGERRFATPPLAFPAPNDQPAFEVLADFAAIALFVERARAVQHGFALTAENANAIVEIGRRLEGLPLAIELAAGWAHMLSPSELRRRLEPRLPLLRGGAEHQPVRLQTMRQAIAWSYDLLAEDEALLFRRLGVFVGGFTIEAAEWVWSSDAEGVRDRSAGRDADPLAALSGLIDKSLVQPSVSNGPEPRFTMLETVREFALEQLAASGETNDVSARHASWCINLADWVRQTGQLSQSRGFTTLEDEHPNLRAALDWLLAHGEVETALHLAGHLAVFWLGHGHMSEGQAWLERALAADDGGPTVARAEALVGLNMLLWWTEGGFHRAEQLLVEAEAVARAAGDVGALAYARLHQGYAAVYQGDLERAAARGEECLETAGAISQGFSLNGARWLLARSSLALGEDDRAAGLYAQLLASARAEGDEISVVNSLIGHAILAERRGEPERALAGLAEAAALCRGPGNRVHASECLDRAAMVAAPGRPELAVRLFAAADALRAAAVGGPPVLVFVADRARQEQTLAAARAALGAERFAQTWAAGAALTFDEAIADATALAQPMPSADHPAAWAEPESRADWIQASRMPAPS